MIDLEKRRLYFRDLAAKRKALGICRQCCQLLPEGRTVMCFTCQPSVQPRIAVRRRREMERIVAQAKSVERAALLHYRVIQLNLNPRDEFTMRKRLGISGNGRPIKRWTVKRIGDAFGVTFQAIEWRCYRLWRDYPALDPAAN